MCITLLKAERTSRIDSSIHASQDSHLARRRHRQVALLKVCSVSFISLYKFIDGCHVFPPYSQSMSALIQQTYYKEEKPYYTLIIPTIYLMYSIFTCYC